MEYSIRDVSEFLNLSREMVRYYEKWGLITPKRNEANNYRSYDILDVFKLMDAVQYKSWGIPVKRMREMWEGDFLEKSRAQLLMHRQELAKEVAYKQLLLDRVEQMAQRAQTAHLNLKNHWIRQIPKHYFIPLIQGDGDQYGTIELDSQMGRLLFSEKVAPFWNPCFEEVGDHQLWGFYLEKRYADALELTNLENMRYRPARICLCGIADLGPVGHFRREYAQPALEYVKEIGYEQGGTMDAVLLGRGVEEGKQIRLVELHIPLREKTL